MGFVPDPKVPCLKGPIPYCLEQCSKGQGAGDRLKRLSAAIRAIAPHFRGLETVFDEHLLPLVFNEARRRAITTHLKTYWFDDSSPEAFFPHQRVAQIYARGVLKALDVSLKGRRTVPLNVWWIVDSEKVRLLTLAEVEKGTTISSTVTLLILTPRPSGTPSSAHAIMGKLAKAWTSSDQGGQVITTAIR